MTEHAGYEVEVYPFAAHDPGLRVLTGGHPWNTGRLVDAASYPHGEVLLRLAENGLDGEDETQVPVIHSSSWRPHHLYPRIILVYFVVVDAGPDIIDRWPDSAPIPRDLLERHGRPVDYDPHGAAEEPLSREWDVMAHAVRHARLLTNLRGEAYDMIAHRAFRRLAGPPQESRGPDEHVSWWDVHLEGLAGAVSGLYVPAVDRPEAA
jgi:hypothetical protein